LSSFRTSNQLSDLLMALLSGEEWKVLYYVIRRTHGLRLPDGNRISLREFAHGHTENGDRKDYGTGLSIPTVEKCLRELRRFGVLIEVEPPNIPESIPAMFRVETDSEQINLAGLESRAEQRLTSNRARTEKAREAKAAAYTVAQNSPDTYTVPQDDPIQSDRDTLSSATEQPPIVAHNPNKESQKYSVSSNGASSRARSKPRSPKGSRGDPKSKHPTIEKYHSTLGRYPPKQLYDSVISLLGDEPDTAFLLDCSVEAAKRGIGHRYDIWLFGWFKDQKIERSSNGNGKTTGNSRADSKQAESSAGNSAIIAASSGGATRRIGTGRPEGE
jgi:hypothetical protein